MQGMTLLCLDDGLASGYRAYMYILYFDPWRICIVNVQYEARR
jgi:hypothetical protein